MQYSKPKISLVTLGTLLVLLFGYTLLVLVIFFRQEINLALNSTPILAEVEVAAASPSQPVAPTSSNQDQLDYAEQVLSHPTNIQPSASTSLLPAEALRQSKRTSFLIGF